MENEQFTFDKFMDDILLKEVKTNKQPLEKLEETPQRQYARKYRELPQNRTKFVREGR